MAEASLTCLTTPATLTEASVAVTVTLSLKQLPPEELGTPATPGHEPSPPKPVPSGAPTHGAEVCHSLRHSMGSNLQDQNQGPLRNPRADAEHVGPCEPFLC